MLQALPPTVKSAISKEHRRSAEMFPVMVWMLPRFGMTREEIKDSIMPLCRRLKVTRDEVSLEFVRSGAGKAGAGRAGAGSC